MCSKPFPIMASIQGRMRNLCKRKYCLKCSPFGKHNTKPIEKFPKDRKAITCSSCGRKYIRNKKKGHTYERCNSCVVNDRRFQIKKRATELLGGVCRICGYSRCSRAMHFHHINPSKKKFEIGGSHCRKWSDIEKELSKCVLLCCRCHAEVEAGLVEITKLNVGMAYQNQQAQG